jgi:hypothetical protein
LSANIKRNIHFWQNEKLKIMSQKQLHTNSQFHPVRRAIFSMFLQYPGAIQNARVTLVSL